MADIILPDSMDYNEYVMAVGSSRPDAVKQIQKGPTTWSKNPIGANGYWSFDIEGQQVRHFLDGRTPFLDFDMANAYTNDLNFPSACGANSIIKRVVIETANGRAISEINNFNNLVALYDGATKSREFLTSNGISYCSYGAAPHGAAGPTLGNADTIHLSIPLKMSVLEKHMIPLMANVGLKIHIYFASLAESFIPAIGAAATSSDITLSNPLLIYDVVEIEPEEMDELMISHDGVFNIVGSDWENQFATVGTTDNALAVQLGFSKRIAKRLYVTLRKSEYLTTAVVNRNAFSRDKGNLSSVELLYNGSRIKNQSLIVDTQGARVYTENMKSIYGSLSAEHLSTLNPVNFLLQDTAETGLSTSALGQFFMCFNLQNLLELEDGSTVSGKNIQMGNFSIKFNKADVTAAMQADMYLEYENSLELNMNPGSSNAGVWTISD